MAGNSEEVTAHGEATRASQEGVPTPDPTGALYRAFDSYPWQKDQEFASQLIYNLYNTAPETSALADIALQVRVRRFEDKTKLRVDPDAYKQWLADTSALQPRLVPEQMIAEEATALPETERRLARLLRELGDELGNRPPGSGDGGGRAAAAPVPSWQAAAPKADLYIQKDASSHPSDPDKEPYPKKFEEIVEFIRTGKEIPGIRKIPDTVIDDPTITPQGRLKAPPKPWEVARTPAAGDSVPAPQSGDGSLHT